MCYGTQQFSTLGCRLTGIFAYAVVVRVPLVGNTPTNNAVADHKVKPMTISTSITSADSSTVNTMC
eukprot:16736-Heterococcus_DN1.PRE.2